MKFLTIICLLFTWQCHKLEFFYSYCLSNGASICNLFTTFMRSISCASESYRVYISNCTLQYYIPPCNIPCHSL
uniref:Putative secreted protein n=1 Tax=Panstrongylus lignarius TaxID=156445 RepID=A0A224Y0K5_9HEMI